MADYADLIGVPFKYGGRGPDCFDCYGLVMEMSRRDGIELPDFGFVSSKPVIECMMQATLPQWEQIEKAPGAVVYIRVGKHAAHVGYMLDDDRMIHTWESSGGVTVQRIEDWKHRVVGFYRYAGRQKDSK